MVDSIGHNCDTTHRPYLQRDTYKNVSISYVYFRTIDTPKRRVQRVNYCRVSVERCNY